MIAWYLTVFSHIPMTGNLKISLDPEKYIGINFEALALISIRFWGSLSGFDRPEWPSMYLLNRRTLYVE